MPEDEPWRPYDWEAFSEGCSSCVIYCHGGCPDGLGAARFASLALGTIGLSRSDIVELGHTDRASKASGLVGPEAAVLYVDISPYAEDLPLLRRARRVAVVDHHDSVGDRMLALTSEMPSLVNLSQTEGDHCAASLIGREMRQWLGGVADIEKKIALLRKKDVWRYAIPSEWAGDASAFIACVQLTPRMTLDIIDSFLEDMPSFLERGVEAMQVLRQGAQDLFNEVRVVAEAEHPVHAVVLGVELRKEIPYDSRQFAQLCQKHANAIILRANLYQSEDQVEVRVSCTGEGLQLGVLARGLHERQPNVYIGGGGHPFAAGLQVTRAGYDLRRVAEDLLHAAGMVPSAIARSRWTDALNIGEVEEVDVRPVRRSLRPTRARTTFGRRPSCESCGDIDLEFEGSRSATPVHLGLGTAVDVEPPPVRRGSRRRPTLSKERCPFQAQRQAPTGLDGKTLTPPDGKALTPPDFTI